MIHKETVIIPLDSSGIFLAKVFHLYSGYHRKVSYIGNFVKTGVKITKPDSSYLRKRKFISLISQTTKETTKTDGSWIKFKFNFSVFLKDKNVLSGSNVNGVTLHELKRKKLLLYFPGVI